MKTLRTSIVLAIGVAMLSLAACKKNSSSNTSVAATSTAKLSFQMQALDAAPDSTSIDSISGLVWSAGEANIGKFAFEAVRNGVSINIFSRNMTNVDLFALTPLQTYVTLDTGVYKKISITAYLEKTDTILPLKLTGSFTNDSAKVVPIEFDLSDNAVVQVKTDSITINGTTDYTALLALQLNRLTTGISLADLNKATLTNGSIIISNKSNLLLYYKMRANITRCGWYEFRRHRRF